MAEFIERSSLRFGDTYVMLCQASERKGFSDFMIHVGSNQTVDQKQERLKSLRPVLLGLNDGSKSY